MATGDLTTTFATFARDLERASEDIKREVGDLIPRAAESMAGTLTARYPIGPTGRLHYGTRIRSRVGNDFLIPVRQVVGPALAYIWQDGTVQRFAYSRANANRGRSPAHAPGFFERTAVQTRAEMLRRAQGVLDKTREI
jgi:hypothetical protein